MWQYIDLLDDNIALNIQVLLNSGLRPNGGFRQAESQACTAPEDALGNLKTDPRKEILR